MVYATLDDLVRVAVNGWTEVAQRATKDARVTVGLLQDVVAGADTSAWSPEVVAVATAGLADLQAHLQSASRYADTFIVGRYPAGLTPDQVAASDLATVVATVAMRRLYGYSVSKEMLEGTKWADDYLKGISSGAVSFGPAAGVSAGGEEGEVFFEFSPRSVTDDDLRGF